MEQWIAADARRATAIAELQTSWSAPRDEDNAIDLDVALRVMAERMGVPVSVPAPLLRTGARTRRIAPFGATHRVAKRVRWGIGFAAAASLLVFVGIGLSVTRKGHPTAIATVPARDVTTQRGERAALDLPDGTRIVLAPGSRLRVPATYPTATGVGERNVQLEGEAYFQVRHDAARPFRVRTAMGMAEDLGTEFVVTIYPETRGMRVAVASGEVALHRTDTARVALARLRGGDFAQLDSLGTATVRRDIDVQRYFAWTTGRLAFKETPLREALPAIMRWYNVEIRLADSTLATRQLTATFDRESTQDVVQLLEYSLNARAEWRGRVVTFHTRPDVGVRGNGVRPSHPSGGNR